MASFGDSLRRERELRQITLREISEATKINHRYLEALEKNDFRHLPGGVFNKGFVRAYAQYIGVDPDRMVLAYLEEERRQAGPAPAELPAARETRGKAFSVRRHERKRARRIAWTVALVVVAAAALFAAVRLEWLPLPWGSAREANRVDGAPPPAPVSRAERSLPEPDPGPEGIVFRLIRPARGMLRCEDGTEWDLTAVAVGTEIVLDCPGGIFVDADDGGALLIEGRGIEAGPIGPDGTAVTGFRVLAAPPDETRP